MEPDRDPQLSALLGEWRAPDAPPSLDAQVLGRTRSPLQFLLRGHIRVPIPVCVAIVAALVIMAFLTGREQRPAAPQPSHPVFNLRDFQPVQDAQVRVIRRQHANQ
jgi:hypothetical protein